MRVSVAPNLGSTIRRVFALPFMWIVLAGAFLAVDYVTGPTIQFPIASVFPVGLAAYHRGFRWAAPFACGLPLFLFGFNVYWDVPWGALIGGINMVIRILILLGFAWFVSVTIEQKRRISTLEKLLCVCAWCKRIRNPSTGWQSLESYLSQETASSITHGMCPDCAAKTFFDE